MKKLLYILPLVLLFASCKKQPLPDLPGDTGPYYSVKGYMDGEYIDLNVGQEGIIISQGVNYNNGVQSYFGQILSPSEDILIKVEVTRPEAPITPSGLAALQEGSLSYLVHEPGCLTPSFGTSSLQSNYLLIKDENGAFQPATEVEFDEYGMYNVTMKFTDAGANSFEVPVQYGYKPLYLNADFTVFPFGDSINLVSIIPSGSHEWYVNNSLISTEDDFNYQLPIGIHKITHRLRDDNNNEAEYTTLVRIVDYVFEWQMAMNGCNNPNNASNFGKVTVSVVKNGIEYSSDKTALNNQNSFNVSNVEYVANASAEPSRAVFDIDFDVVLFDQSGTESITLTDITGTFNVGLQ